jgi:hypothetical protein
MSSDDTPNKPKPANQTLNRRNMLLAGTTLAAASTIAAVNPSRVAQAQQTAARGVEEEDDD